MNNNTKKAQVKKALVIGCTGTFGNAIALELVKQGWHVKALLRSPKKRPHWLAEEDTYIGDCNSLETLQHAITGVDLVVYGANPLYHQWSELAESMMEKTVQLAEKKGLHLLFPGNVYNYDPQSTPLISEKSHVSPVTEKGKIRVAMEERLSRAAKNGATITIIRSGDFIAKEAQSSWFNHLLSKNKNGWSLSNPSPQGHQHSYVWLPDMAANAVALLALDKKGFNVWHEAGVVATHQDWLNTMQDLDLKVASKPLLWWQLKLVGLFDPVVKEVVKMRYLWQQSVYLDGTKMQNALGSKYRSSSLTDIMRALTNSNN